MKRISLMDYFDEWYLVEVEISAATQTFSRNANIQFEKWHGGPVYLDELTERLINRWIIARSSEGKSPKTIRNDRNVVLAIWQHAEDNPDVECPTLRRRKVRKVKLPRKSPVGFTLEQVQALLDATRRFRSDRKQLYWRTMIHVAYESALRRGDLFALDDISDDGIVTITMHKTGDVHCVRVRPETVLLLRQLPSRPLAPLSSYRAFDDDHRNLKRWAGIEGVGGFCQPLRRTAASYVERDNPGMGARMLGHRTPGLAEKHYFIPGIVRSRIAPPPPSLDGMGAVMEPIVRPSSMSFCTALLVSA